MPSKVADDRRWFVLVIASALEVHDDPPKRGSAPKFKIQAANG
jgi:hypothetical protein